MSEITLANLGGGAAVAKFEQELAKLAKNIMDPNTDAEVARTVTLTVTVKPSKDRNWAGIKISAIAKLAPNVAYTTRAFVGLDHASGKVVICEDNPNQMILKDFMGKPDNVESIKSAKDKVESAE